MDTKAEQTPPEAIVILPEHRDKHGRFLPGVPKMPNTTGAELVNKRWAAHAAGVRAGLKAAAAEHEGTEGLSLAGSTAIYSKEIGKGILANAMERPHDAARAYVSMARAGQVMAERGNDAVGNAVTLSVTLAGPVVEAWLKRMHGDEDS